MGGLDVPIGQQGVKMAGDDFLQNAGARVLGTTMKNVPGVHSFARRWFVRLSFVLVCELILHVF